MNDCPQPSPRLVVLLSGKRKSGKDFVTDKIFGHFNSSSPNVATVIRLSAPLKKRFADERGLDFEKLLDSSEYKEIFRKEMIVWGEEKRRGDPGFFCRAAIEDAVAGYHSSFLQSSASRLPPSSLSSSSPSSFSCTPSFIDSASYPHVWIVSDARRQTDLQFFLDHYKDILVTIRVVASESSRIRRGWNFTRGVDDVESECGLDAIDHWDFVLHNDDGDDDEKNENYISNENILSNSCLSLTGIISKLDDILKHGT